jgi:hypothetical protein
MQAFSDPFIEKTPFLKGSMKVCAFRMALGHFSHGGFFS